MTSTFLNSFSGRLAILGGISLTLIGHSTGEGGPNQCAGLDSETLIFTVSGDCGVKRLKVASNAADCGAYLLDVEAASSGTVWIRGSAQRWKSLYSGGWNTSGNLDDGTSEGQRSYCTISEPSGDVYGITCKEGDWSDAKLRCTALLTLKPEPGMGGSK